MADTGNDNCYNNWKLNRAACEAAFEAAYFACPSGPSGTQCRMDAIQQLEECLQDCLDKFRNCVEGIA